MMSGDILIKVCVPWIELSRIKLRISLLTLFLPVFKISPCFFICFTVLFPPEQIWINKWKIYKCNLAKAWDPQNGASYSNSGLKWKLEVGFCGENPVIHTWKPRPGSNSSVKLNPHVKSGLELSSKHHSYFPWMSGPINSDSLTGLSPDTCATNGSSWSFVCSQ